MTEPKRVGRPRVGTDDDPIVTLTVTVRKSDADYLISVNRNISKAVRQFIKERKEQTTMDTDISSQIETIRDYISRADSTPILEMQLGNILFALSHITDLLEQTNKRIDQADRVIRELVSINA